MLQIVLYDKTNMELTVAFNKTPKKEYIYKDVSPYFYNKIRLFISKKNWKKVSNLLHKFK